MEFNSLLYVLLFLPIVWSVFYLLRHRHHLQNIFLIAASVVFYCYAVFWYFIPLLVSSILDYFIGQKIHASDDEAKRKRLMITSIVVNISMMSFFKYTGWLSGELAAFLATFGIAFSQINVVLPPGISFYTFQTMSYTIDIYRRDFEPKKGFVNYLTFVSFFPQLVAGPIERAKNLLPQLSAPRPMVTWTVASSALFFIAWGLFLKVGVADNFGAIIDNILRRYQHNNETFENGLGLIFAYAFAFQIYCDFSAYSIIARGTARLFSIELSRNFLTPYFATSPSEFWQRWHITLSQWLRDYVYIPLGGNKKGRLFTLRNLLITMFLGGLWHGAGVLFIVWGVYHGLLLVLYHTLPIDQLLARYFGERLGKVVGIIVFFHLVCLGWIFFRATPEQLMPLLESIAVLPSQFLAIPITLWDGLAAGAGAAASTKAAIREFLVNNEGFAVLGWGVIMFAIPVVISDWIAYRKNCEFVDLFESMHWLVRTAVLCIAFYGIIIFGRREANEFIYFAF